MTTKDGVGMGPQEGTRFYASELDNEFAFSGLRTGLTASLTNIHPASDCLRLNTHQEANPANAGRAGPATPTCSGISVGVNEIDPLHADVPRYH